MIAGADELLGGGGLGAVLWVTLIAWRCCDHRRVDPRALLLILGPAACRTSAIAPPQTWSGINHQIDERTHPRRGRREFSAGSSLFATVSAPLAPSARLGSPHGAPARRSAVRRRSSWSRRSRRWRSSPCWSPSSLSPATRCGAPASPPAPGHGQPTWADDAGQRGPGLAASGAPRGRVGQRPGRRSRSRVRAPSLVPGLPRVPVTARAGLGVEGGGGRASGDRPRSSCWRASRRSCSPACSPSSCSPPATR